LRMNWCGKQTRKRHLACLFEGQSCHSADALFGFL
jgi:hypothetical protein